MSAKYVVVICTMIACLAAGTDAKLDITANVAAPSAINPGLPFKDLIWQSQGWMWAELNDHGTKPGVFGGTDRYPWPITPVPVHEIRKVAPLDENNWPTQVPFTYDGKQYRPVLVPFHWFVPANLIPLGTYTFIGEGKGIVDFGWEIDLRIELKGGTTVVEFDINTLNPANTFTSDVFNAGLGLKSSGLCMTIVQSDPNDHVRNIHVIRPDLDGGTSWVADFKECPYNPEWLESHRIYASLRYMGAASPNANNVVHWEDRITPDMIAARDDMEEHAPYAEEATYVSPNHLPWEYQIKMSNATGIDPWLTVPSKADSNYVVNLARLVYDMLDPSLDLYLEWANETWNPIFYSHHQTPYIRSHYNSHVSGNEEAHAYMACRNVGIFRAVFGAERDRVIGVVSGFGASAGVGEKIVAALKKPAINPNNVTIDAYAIADYFAIQGPNADRVRTAKTLADNNGMRCLMYEGGTEWGRSPAMYDVYRNALATYDQIGIENFNAFIAVDGWGNFGDWGFLLYNNQPLEQAHKYRALYEWAVSNGQYDPNSSIPGCSGTSVRGGNPRAARHEPQAQPNPAGASGPAAFYDMQGRRLRGGPNNGSVTMVRIEARPHTTQPLIAW